MIPRNTGRKIAFGFAIFSFVCMLVSVAVLGYFQVTRGSSDVATASMFATTLFFLSCGIVLYLMGKPPKHELQPWDSVEKAEETDTRV